MKDPNNSDIVVNESLYIQLNIVLSPPKKKIQVEALTVFGKWLQEGGMKPL